MDKVRWIGVAVVVIVIAVLVNRFTSMQAQTRIAVAEKELEMLRAEVESIDSLASVNDSLQGELFSIQGELRKEVEERVELVRQLERRRASEQLRVRRLRKTADLVLEFEKAFPEWTNGMWGVEEVFVEEVGLAVEMVMLHASVMDGMITLANNWKSLAEQRDTLVSVVGLQDSIQSLSDSIFALERETRTAYQEGLYGAFGRYEDLNGRYIAEVKKPRLGFNLPTTTAVLGSFALGLSGAVFACR